MNVSMEQYLRVFVNHQQDDWVKWLLLAEFAANNGTSETTKCTPLLAVQGVDPRMSFVGGPTKDQDQQRVSADQVQATMQQIHEHLRVEMRLSQAVQEAGANRGRVPATNIQEGSQVWLDARLVPTTRHTRKLDWKRLGPFTVVRRISPHQQNVNRSGSNTQSSQTLRATSPVLLGTSRCSQTPLELSKVLSDSARAFSGAPESTCGYGGAFRMLRDLTYRILKFWSF